MENNGDSLRVKKDLIELCEQYVNNKQSNGV